jgi:hypothetical protein
MEPTPGTRIRLLNGLRKNDCKGSLTQKMYMEDALALSRRGWTACPARMVKSADTADLKSADPNQVVGVQVPLRAPK